MFVANPNPTTSLNSSLPEGIFRLIALLIVPSLSMASLSSTVKGSTTPVPGGPNPDNPQACIVMTSVVLTPN